MTTLFKNMIDRYNAVAFTHNYIWGFEFHGVIYMAHTDADVMPYICKLDRASRGAGMALRFCPKVDQKVLLLPYATPLCSVKYFNEVKASDKYNNGEIFEKLVTEYYNQTWVKDNVPFTKDGDLTVDGIAYQIKYEKATFCNEKSLKNLTK